MSYDIKKILKKSEKKMDITMIRKHNTGRQSPEIYPKSLTFFPLSEETKDLCRNIDQTLFQLEKDLAYFRFAIKEIKDIT